MGVERQRSDEDRANPGFSPRATQQIPAAVTAAVTATTSAVRTTAPLSMPLQAARMANPSYPVGSHASSTHAPGQSGPVPPTVLSELQASLVAHAGPHANDILIAGSPTQPSASTGMFDMLGATTFQLGAEYVVEGGGGGGLCSTPCGAVLCVSCPPESPI